MKIIKKSASFIPEGTGKKKKIVRKENWSVTEDGKKKEISPDEEKKFESLFKQHTEGLNIEELISFDIYETSEGNYTGICNYRQNGQHQQHRFKEKAKTAGEVSAEESMIESTEAGTEAPQTPGN